MYDDCEDLRTIPRINDTSRYSYATGYIRSAWTNIGRRYRIRLFELRIRSVYFFVCSLRSRCAAVGSHRMSRLHESMTDRHLLRIVIENNALGGAKHPLRIPIPRYDEHDRQTHLTKFEKLFSPTCDSMMFQTFTSANKTKTPQYSVWSCESLFPCLSCHVVDASAVETSEKIEDSRTIALFVLELMLLFLCVHYVYSYLLSWHIWRCANSRSSICVDENRQILIASKHFNFIEGPFAGGKTSTKSIWLFRWNDRIQKSNTRSNVIWKRFSDVALINVKNMLYLEKYIFENHDCNDMSTHYLYFRDQFLSQT